MVEEKGEDPSHEENGKKEVSRWEDVTSGEQEWQSAEGGCLLEEVVGGQLRGLCGQRTRGRELCCCPRVGWYSVA